MATTAEQAEVPAILHQRLATLAATVGRRASVCRIVKELGAEPQMSAVEVREDAYSSVAAGSLQ